MLACMHVRVHACVFLSVCVHTCKYTPAVLSLPQGALFAVGGSLAVATLVIAVRLVATVALLPRLRDAVATERLRRLCKDIDMRSTFIHSHSRTHIPGLYDAVATQRLRRLCQKNVTCGQLS